MAKLKKFTVHWFLLLLVLLAVIQREFRVVYITTLQVGLGRVGCKQTLSLGRMFPIYLHLKREVFEARKYGSKIQSK